MKANKTSVFTQKISLQYFIQLDKITTYISCILFDVDPSISNNSFNFTADIAKILWIYIDDESIQNIFFYISYFVH